MQMGAGVSYSSFSYYRENMDKLYPTYCVECKRMIYIVGYNIMKRVVIPDFSQDPLMDFEKFQSVVESGRYRDLVLRCDNCETKKRKKEDEDHNGHSKKLEKNKIKIIETIPTCIICFNRPRDTLIIDCNHLAICKECLPKVLEVKLCPICRNSILSTLPVFIS
jgi:hypothetical protein